MDCGAGQIRAVTWAAIAALLAGCAPAGHDYFPLGTEQSWEYSLQRTIKGEKHTGKIVIANLAPATLKGTTLYPKRRLDNRLEWFRKTDKGIFRVGPGLRPLREVLPLPVKVGSQWQDITRVRFLRVTGAFARTFKERAHKDMPIHYVVESVSDTVEVPAGRFENCLRVSGKGSILGGQILDQFLGIHEIRVAETDWYAPGVGLVKRVRTESTSPANWNNRSVEQLEARL